MSFFLGGVGTVEHIDETRDSITGVVTKSLLFFLCNFIKAIRL